MKYSPTIFLTVDIIIRSKRPEDSILLIKRKKEPFKDMWALPGGFVDQGEDLPEAAKRELREETGILVESLRQLGAFGKPDRDPRHHTVSVVYYGTVSSEVAAIAADDAADAGWFSIQQLPPLAFDHEEIISLWRQTTGL